jgi:hypothetical protein
LLAAELAVVDSQGQTPWRLEQAYEMDSIGPSEELPNHVLQAKPRLAAQAYPWVKVQRWLREVALPREFYPRQPEPLGESRIP